MTTIDPQRERTHCAECGDVNEAHCARGEDCDGTTYPVDGPCTKPHHDFLLPTAGPVGEARAALLRAPSDAFEWECRFCSGYQTHAAMCEGLRWLHAFEQAVRADAEAENRRLREALAVAIDLAEEGWGYSTDYFRDKWGYAERLKRARAALGEGDGDG